MGKKLTRRELLRAAGVAGSLSLLAACQPKVVEVEKVVTQVVKETVVIEGTPQVVEKVVEKVVTPEAPKPVARGPVELSIWLHWGGNTRMLAQQMVDQFNDGPGVDKEIKVVIEAVDTDAYREKVMAVRLAGTPPDIYHMWLTTLDMVANGIAMELPEEEQQYVRDNYIEPGVAAVTLGGKVYGYPTEIQGTCLAYRKSKLEQAGLTQPPQDMVEMREYAKILTKEEGGVKTYGFSIQWPDWPLADAFPALIARVGGQMYYMNGDVPERIDVSSKQAFQAAQWWRDMVDDGSTNVPEVGGWEALQNGLACMMEIYPWVAIILLRDQEGTPREVYDDLGITAVKPWPGQKPVGFLEGGWKCCVDRLSKDPEASFEVLKWMFHKPDMPMSRFIVEQIGAVPAPKDYPLPIPGWSDEMNKGWGEEAPKIGVSFPYNKVLGSTEISAAIQSTLEAIVLQQQDTEPALTALQPKVDEILLRTDSARMGLS